MPLGFPAREGRGRSSCRKSRSSAGAASCSSTWIRTPAPWPIISACFPITSRMAGTSRTATRCCTYRRSWTPTGRRRRKPFSRPTTSTPPTPRACPPPATPMRTVRRLQRERQPVRPHHRPSQPALHPAPDAAGDPRQAAHGAQRASLFPRAGWPGRWPPNTCAKDLGKQWGVDLSKYSDSEMLDSIEYWLFPNMFMFPRRQPADDLSFPPDRHGPGPHPVRPAVPAAARPRSAASGGAGAASPDAR